MTRNLLSALLLGALLALVGCAAQPQVIEGEASAATTPNPTTANSFEPVGPTAYTVPNVTGMSGTEAAAVLAASGFTNIKFEQNGAPPEASVLSQNPPPGTTATPDTVISLVAEIPEPARDISSRDWALIAKSPDSHVGERIIVYGNVTQFDSATGTSIFRANVDGDQHDQWYDYDTNTFLTGSDTMFAEVVQDDIFRAEVTVAGSYSYTTTMGGTMTVPQLTVDKIDVIGSTS